MKLKWLFTSIAIGAVTVLWLLADGKVDLTPLRSAIGIKPASDRRAANTSKPICWQVIVPVGTDCVPQHLAKLPPDPGPAGERTLQGIDSDNDGVRDDVQRFIALNYGHSERAVVALREIAKGAQQQILIGDSISGDEAKKIGNESMKRVACFARSVDQEMVFSGAIEKLVTEITNTPERFKQKGKFEVLAANRVYEFPMDSAPVLCGYDPAKLPN